MTLLFKTYYIFLVTFQRSLQRSQRYSSLVRWGHCRPLLRQVKEKVVLHSEMETIQWCGAFRRVSKKLNILIKTITFWYFSTDEPLSNMTNCEALILAYHRIKRSFSRYKLKQVQERINKVKQRNKRKLKLKTLMPDEPPILDSELPRFVSFKY